MKQLIVMLFVIGMCNNVIAYNRIPDKYVEALVRVESRGNHRAIGDHGRAYGILQIHKGVILDVNRWYGTHYRHVDAFDPVKARKICKMYAYKMLTYKHKKVTLWNVALCWNRNAVLHGRYAHRVRQELAYC